MNSREMEQVAQTMPENTRVLRFFAADTPARTAVLDRLAAEGGLQWQEMRKGSEVLVVLQGAPARLDAAEAAVRSQVSAGLYATGAVTLPAAAVQALQEADRLFVAADAATGALLEKRLQLVPGADGVYDFGTQSYAHAGYGPRIASGGAWGRRAGADVLLLAQGRIQEARRLSGAHYAAAAVPAADSGTTLLVGSRKTIWIRRVSGSENPALWLLDILRRAALGAPQAEGTVWQPYGPLQAPAAQPPAPEPDILRQAAARRRQEAPASAYLPPKEVQPAAPRQSSAPEPPAARGGRHGMGRLLAGLLIVAAAAALAVAAAYALSGGDILSLWGRSGLRPFHISGASLL